MSEEIKETVPLSDEEKIRIAMKFETELANSQIDLEPDISEMIEEKFWEMI